MYFFDETDKSIINLISSENCALLKMSFGESEIINQTRLDTSKSIEEIILVYSEFKEISSFSQSALNVARIEKLALVYSNLKTPTYKTAYYAHKNIDTKEMAQDLFHGFIIIYENRKVTSAYKRAMEGRRSAEDTEAMDSVTSDEYMFDTIFKRNFGWQEMLVVTDLTASMSPYVAQLLAWHTLNYKSSGIKNYVFFNDGDDKGDDKKRVGSAGGVYYSNAKSLKNVLSVADLCAKKGGGGDIPENNMEATIKGLAKYKGTKDLILIVDNWATPRDVRLTKAIKKPIKIIVCGAADGIINPVWLTIAKQTKGSVHTMYDDLKNLAKVQEGKTIKINNITYRVANGKFIQVLNL